MDNKDFCKRAEIVHNCKYDYSNVEYLNNHTKVCIICPYHGEFWQTPNGHLQGKGCRKCGYQAVSKKLTSNNTRFITKATQIHGGKYDYSKVEYFNSNKKVCIICSRHGEFWQAPRDHVRGIGCPKCGRTVKKNTSEFISKANQIHLYRFDYSKVNYINSKTKVCIICPEHGEFWQRPNDHIDGHGCPMCGGVYRYSTKDFVTKSNLIHNCKYDYSKAEYVNANTSVCIICADHGEFWQKPINHLSGCGCPKCGQVMSKVEDEIIELLSELQPQQRNRNILDKQEIDIYIPQLKLGIEYNGLRWHSEEFGKDKNYHIGKLNECNSKGIRLIQIFEDEWVNHREVCESKLNHICGLEKHKPKVFARKCSVREITNTEAKAFLDKNHIQGFASSTIYLGCYTDDNHLVGVMNFKKEKEGYWDLNRFATDIRYNCIGIGSKLFKYFTQNYDYQEIKSFADRRWTTDPSNNLYTKLGFDFVEHIRPDYRYIISNKMERFYKFGFRKQILHKKYGLPPSMTEYEMSKQLGYTRIWDCGLIKYVYKKT